MAIARNPVSKLQQPEKQTPTRTGISARALVVGLVAVTLTCFLVTYSEIVVKQIQIGILQFPPAAIGLLFLLVIINRGFRRLGERLALKGYEIITIYCMTLVAAMISSRGLMEKVLPVLAASNYYANPQNKWARLIFPHIKKWMVPYNPAIPDQQPVTKLYYEAIQNGEKIPWGLWLVPLAAWSVIVILVLFGFLCLASIVRRQWTDNEKLTFPLVQLPLEMAKEQETSFFRSRLLWIGFSIPAVIFTLNGLNGLFPSVPSIGLDINLNSMFVDPPMNAMFYTHAFLSFAAIGFFYFLPSDVLFALWFFFILTRVSDVIIASWGIVPDEMPLYPTRRYIGFQVAGAYCTLALYYLYVGLPHFRKVLAAAFRRGRREDRDEVLPYGVAFWGLVLAIAGSAVWCWVAGMSLWLAFFIMIIYMLIVAVVMARSTAEAGMLMTETSFRPVDIYRLFTSTSAMGATNMTLLAFMDTAFFRDQRGLMLTGFLDGFRMSDGVGIRRRSLVGVFALGIITAILVAGYLHLTLPYQRGAMNLYDYAFGGNSRWAIDNYVNVMNGQSTWQASNIAFFLVGVAVTAFLVIMRLTFFWWPLHPLGYALCASWSMIVFWFPCFVTWLVKGLIIRYGGMKLYIKGKPLFLGFILGEFTMAVLWAVISSVFGVSAPAFPWP